MQVSLVGINHKTATVAIREKMAVRSDDLAGALTLLGSHTPYGVILSTCNRTEVYTTGSNARETSLNFLSTYLGIPKEALIDYVYSFQDRETIEHIFRVAAGLDSMVVGEFEILGQVGGALEAAETAGAVNLPLRQLFRNAIRTGRLVREETGISRNAISVSSVSVGLAMKKVGSFKDCKILVIGAGEAGRLVAKAARDRGATRIFVTSRTAKRASALAAELSSTPFSLNQLVDEMKTADIVVACADAPHWVLDSEQVAEALRDHAGTPLVIIDIGVPRNVEPAIADIKNVFLYDIDDLTRISEANHQGREAEIGKASGIVAEESAKFFEWWQGLKYRPVVSALMSKAYEIRRLHLEKTLKKLRPLSDKEREYLEAMTKAIVTKLLHDPIQCLKTENGHNGDYAKAVNELFRLDADSRKLKADK